MTGVSPADVRAARHALYERDPPPRRRATPPLPPTPPPPDTPAGPAPPAPAGAPRTPLGPGP